MSGRVWGGLTADEREQRRREQLLDAALEAFATSGFNSTTVADICKLAKLSPRYLYDTFGGREQLFAALVQRIMADVTKLSLAAVAREDLTPQQRARETLQAVADYVTADPRSARVALVESQATAATRELRRQMLSGFAILAARLMQALDPEADPDHLALAAEVLSGGLAELLTREEPIQPERLEPLFTAAARSAPRSGKQARHKAA